MAAQWSQVERAACSTSCALWMRMRHCLNYRSDSCEMSLPDRRDATIAVLIRSEEQTMKRQHYRTASGLGTVEQIHNPATFISLWASAQALFCDTPCLAPTLWRLASLITPDKRRTYRRAASCW